MSDIRTKLLQPSAVAWSGEIAGFGEVYLRELTGDDLDYIRGGKVPDERAIMARIAVSVLCDADGKRLFKRNEDAQVNQSPLRHLRAISEEATKHCGLADEDVEEISGN